MKTLDATKKSPEWPQWHKAVLEELETLKTMGTWELGDLPEGREPIGNRWTFVKKRDENGKIARYKARLVAQGFTQKPGTDFSNTGTFAPVMRFETLRTLLAMSVIDDWELRQMDIKGAYLNGKIVEELYMKQPTGFEDGTAQYADYAVEYMVSDRLETYGTMSSTRQCGNLAIHAYEVITAPIFDITGTRF